MSKKRLLGIKIFGLIFICSSLYYLIGNSNFSYYKFMFQQLPDNVIKLRYSFTIFLRVVGIIIGLGILLRKDIFRKIAIAVCAFTIATIYWKHPYFVFYNIAAHVECGIWKVTPACKLVHPWHPMAIMVFFYLWDIGFSLLCIRYFFRPDVKKEFN